jgi:hypothetical protein
MNYRYGEVVNAWLGQSDEPFLTVFTEAEAGDPDDCVRYSTKVALNTWVTPTPINVCHVKSVEEIHKH